MPRTSRLATGLAAIAALTLGLAAQSSDRPPHDSTPVTGAGLQRAGDGWIGTGAGYRVAFGADGVEFAPLSGAPQPAAARLRLRPSSIRRGASAVAPLGVAGLPAPTPHGTHTVHYAHPQGVTERYELRGDGVELSYVFAQRPVGTGDLIVRLVVDSGSLAAPRADGATTLDFGDDPESGAEIHIGAVTGIDAAGRTAPGWMNWDGANLELVLPGTFVDAATYPLVLDPVIGSPVFVTSQTPYDDAAPDVAYVSSGNQYLFVWERLVAANDYDVVGRFVDAATGAPTGAEFTIAGGAGNQRRPSVASVNYLSRFVVVWDTDVAGNRDVLCRYVVPGSGTLGSVVLVAASAADESAPDIGGQSGTSASFLVVYRSSTAGIWGRGGVVTGSLLVMLPTAVAIYGNTNAQRPSICKGGGALGRYFVAWEDSPTFIGARAVTSSGSALSAVGGISAAPGTTMLRPEVAGDGDRFLLVYQQYESGSSGRSDVWAINMVIPGSASNLWSYTRKAPLVNVPGVDEYAPSVCLPGPYFAVTWTEEQPNTRREAHTVNVSAGTWATCGRVHASGFNPTIQTKMAAKREADASTVSDEAMIASERRSGAPAGDILAQRYETFGGGAILDRGGQCGGAVTLTAAGGPFSLGNQDFGLDVSVGVPAGQAIMLFAFGPTPATFRCGSGCELLLPVVSINFAIQQGAARFPLAVVCDPNVFGLQLHAQALVVTPGIDPCNLAPVSLSNRLELVHGD